MGKMKEKDLKALRREDVNENNWELEEEKGARSKEQVCDPVQVLQPMAPVPETESQRQKRLVQEAAESATSYCGPNYKPVEAPDELKEVFRGITDGTVETEEMKRSIYFAWIKVDPKIRTGNPVWKFSRKDNKFVFIFRSGQKARVEL